VSRPQGLRVYCPKNPDWGVGHVLADDGGARVTVFFLRGGSRTLDTTIAELDLVTGKAAVNPILMLSPCQAAPPCDHGARVVSVERRPEGWRSWKNLSVRRRPVRRRAAGHSELLALANVARVLYPQSVCGARRATRRPRVPVP
jgi:hypothetical protein